MSYQQFVLTEESRAKLKAVFPPKFPDFIGHHVTYKLGKSGFEDSFPAKFYVYGYSEEEGLEALVVGRHNFKTLDNSGTHRPDGKLFHVTWSLDRSIGKKPADSNALVARGFTLVHPLQVFDTTFQLVQ